jgi:DNA-binding winged helix-turn-helix (wHTH) protein
MHMEERDATQLGGRDFLLGDWLVQPSLNSLTRGGESRRLEPKIMDVLVCLCERAGAVVPKTFIIDTVWATRFRCESVLSRAIAEIRTSLGDSARTPRYLATISKRGYRVVAPVRARSPSQSEATAAGPVLALVLGDRELPLADGEWVLGRAPDAGVRIDAATVSRHHARVVVSGSRVTIEDLGSKNGTALRGERISAVTELHDGDEVFLGSASLVFRSIAATATTRTCAVREG